eukprot:TRINITY_DN27664_c0_g1_i1.p1 TRINITY_DN27664_c0_g1~~TRINITY_DN27664_c0_g1_i1.p1  ORF type:complete len:757 (-),score=49.50 TRINITY_DN27664_c0_g1_i1:74-2290(-)
MKDIPDEDDVDIEDIYVALGGTAQERIPLDRVISHFSSFMEDNEDEADQEAEIQPPSLRTVSSTKAWGNSTCGGVLGLAEFKEFWRRMQGEGTADRAELQTMLEALSVVDEHPKPAAHKLTDAEKPANEKDKADEAEQTEKTEQDGAKEEKKDSNTNAEDSEGEGLPKILSKQSMNSDSKKQAEKENANSKDDCLPESTSMASAGSPQSQGGGNTTTDDLRAVLEVLGTSGQPALLNIPGTKKSVRITAPGPTKANTGGSPQHSSSPGHSHHSHGRLQQAKYVSTDRKNLKIVRSGRGRYKHIYIEKQIQYVPHPTSVRKIKSVLSCLAHRRQSYVTPSDMVPLDQLPIQRRYYIASLRIQNFFRYVIFRKSLLNQAKATLHTETLPKKPIGFLSVRIGEGIGLHAPTLGEGCDPFCIMWLVGNPAHSTTAKYRTVSPVWNEAFPIATFSVDHEVVVSCWNRTYGGGDELIGKARIKVGALVATYFSNDMGKYDPNVTRSPKLVNVELPVPKDEDDPSSPKSNGPRPVITLWVEAEGFSLGACQKCVTKYGSVGASYLENMKKLALTELPVANSPDDQHTGKKTHRDGFKTSRTNMTHRKSVYNLSKLELDEDETDAQAQKAADKLSGQDGTSPTKDGTLSPSGAYIQSTAFTDYSPPKEQKLPTYEAEEDPHLLWYWKRMKKKQKGKKKRSKELPPLEHATSGRSLTPTGGSRKQRRPPHYTAAGRSKSEKLPPLNF